MDPTVQDEIPGKGSENSIPGVAVATVTDNEDPEDLARVKVTYPWQDADDSYWARIATTMTGKDYGSYFLPEKDDEVLVAFENGDINSPFVVGELWNEKQQPPDPDDGDNDIRMIKTSSGHRVEFDDEADRETVTIETSAGHRIVMDDESGSEKVTVEDKSGSNSIELDSSKGEVSVTGQQKISLSAPEIELNGKQQVDVNSKAEVNIEGKAKVDVSSKGQLDLTSSGLAGLESSGPLTIKGAVIQLN